jgi:DNA-binding NarL/FixJ family response regulator
MNFENQDSSRADIGPILILCDDLLLRVRIEELAREAGHTARTVRPSVLAETPDVLRQAVALVIDLHLRNQPALDLIQKFTAAAPTLPIIAFGAHTDPQLLSAGLERGALYSIPRSRLVRDFSKLIDHCLKV